MADAPANLARNPYWAPPIIGHWSPLPTEIIMLFALTRTRVHVRAGRAGAASRVSSDPAHPAIRSGWRTPRRTLLAIPTRRLLSWPSVTVTSLVELVKLLFPSQTTSSSIVLQISSNQIPRNGDEGVLGSPMSIGHWSPLPTEIIMLFALTRTRVHVRAGRAGAASRHRTLVAAPYRNHYAFRFDSYARARAGWTCGRGVAPA
jgi:hypothetical protein